MPSSRSARRARRRRNAALGLALPWAACAVLRATGAEWGFPLVPALSFTPYAAVGAVLPLGVAGWARSRPAAVLSFASAAILAGAVLGRAGRQGSPSPPGGRRLQLASVNLRLGHADPAGVVELVRSHDLDVLSVQELTPAADLALRAAGIGDLLPHSHVITARTGSPPAAGGGLWSRLAVLERRAVPGRFEQPVARLAVPGAPDVEMTAVHATPPASSSADVRRWAEDLAALPGAGPGVLRVLAGDFNATLDHATLRAVLGRGYTDAARAVGRALTATWAPMRWSHPRLTLDHVLVDSAIGVAALHVVPVAGSDHRGLVADLVLPRANR